MSGVGGDRISRFAHGSRVPGWDDAADLTKDPAGVPDPATTAVPADLRAEIESHMAKYPDRRSAAIPALAAVQHHYGWCTPEGIEQAASVMALWKPFTAAHPSARQPTPLPKRWRKSRSFS